MAVVWVERGGTEPAGPDDGDLGDVAAAARAVLPPDVWGFVQGGSGAERTLRANRAAYDKVALRPRVLVDVGAISLRTSVLGADWAVPFGVAPMAYHRLAHPDGELASAGAAGELGTMFCASIFASRTFAEMAGATAGPRWLQVYYLRDRDTLADVLARAEQAGFGAIVLTVDTPHVATRPRDLGSSFTLPDDVRAVNLPPTLMGTAHIATTGRSAIQQHSLERHDQAITWADLPWLRARTSLPLLLKGVLTGEDARLAAEHGVDGLVVSNHGGRQLDAAVPSLAALPEVVAAVPESMPVLVDGGARRGSDVFAALALGARAVLIGRPVLWGLSVRGAQGVRDVLDHLRGELVRAMQLAGAVSVSEATRDLVARSR